MRLTDFLVPTALALAGAIPAQAEMLRGEVRTTPDGAYYLNGTDWRVQFVTPILDDWVGQPLLMKAVNHGMPAKPHIKVLSAERTHVVFALGELHLGMYGFGGVYAKPGTFTSVCLDLEANMSWQPFHGMGVWLLGPDPCGFAAGFVNDLGTFKFSFKVPMNVSLAEYVYFGQAMLYEPAGSPEMYFSNLVRRTVTD